MTFSQFTAYYTANKTNVPASLAAYVARTALARVTERMQAGRADSALCFRDLIEKMEGAIAG